MRRLLFLSNLILYHFTSLDILLRRPKVTLLIILISWQVLLKTDLIGSLNSGRFHFVRFLGVELAKQKASAETHFGFWSFRVPINLVPKKLGSHMKTIIWHFQLGPNFLEAHISQGPEKVRGQNDMGEITNHTFKYNSNFSGGSSRSQTLGFNNQIHLQMVWQIFLPMKK